ncbi:MAG: TRAP transporter substrate-binding protein [Deltaproteobacteria bacterium]|nr:TRAP transporter substrate-binding protein [Deltaproteobacteria bacterium]
MANRKVFKIFLVLSLMLILVLPANAARTLKYGHNTKENQPTGRAALLFADLVQKKTNGEIVVHVFPNNQLGNNKQMVDNLRMGALDLCTTGLGILSYLNDAFMIMQLPYAFRSQEHIHRVVKGGIGQELKADLAQKQGIVMLAQDWDRMPRHIAGRKPIKTLDDFKGYKVRCGGLSAMAGFKALGASPVDIPLNEMYLALQQGVTDGAELPTDYIAEYSVFEVSKYYNQTYHTYGTQFLGINKRVWDSLKPEHRKAIQAAADEAGLYNNKLDAELYNDYIEKLKKGGMEFINTDVESFRKATHEKINEICKNWTGGEKLFERIQAVK